MLQMFSQLSSVDMKYEVFGHVKCFHKFGTKRNFVCHYLSSGLKEKVGEDGLSMFI
jgi:hypothetical protein